MQKEIKDLIKKIAKKYNKPEHVIEEIYMSQFQFIKTSISSPEDPSDIKTISLPKWGKYSLSKGKLRWINKHKEKNESDNKINPENTRED